MNKERINLAVSLKDYLENLIEVSIEIASSIREKGLAIEDTSQAFNRVMEGMALVFEALITQFFTEENQINERSQRLQELMSSIVEAMENGDYYTLGDVVEYELIPLQQEWIEEIKIYKEKVDEL